MKKVCANGGELRIDEVRRMLADHCSERGAQAALAERLGVSRAYINQVISGKNPPSRKICKLLRIREDGMRWVRE
jgi:transcriptional regulator with XRE-family HTH domain